MLNGTSDRMIHPLLFGALFLFCVGAANAQSFLLAEDVVKEGIALHDQGKYEEALGKYDAALKLDSNNFTALAEKAVTYTAMKRYEESLQQARKLMTQFKGNRRLGNTYVTAGNTLDLMQKPDQALAMYDDGIKEFPDYYHLYFNKAITLSNLKRYDEAVQVCEKAALANPDHSSSHYVIAVLNNSNKKRIPAILAYCRFLVVEPSGQRALGVQKELLNLMNGDTKKTGKNATTISLSPDMLAGVKDADSPRPNNFAITDLTLSLSAALDHDKKNENKSVVDNFIRKIETVCSSLSETKTNNSGFYWEYYAPYFIELKEKKFIEPFAYLIFSASDDKSVSEWLATHETEVQTFLEWSKSYSWPGLK